MFKEGDILVAARTDFSLSDKLHGGTLFSKITEPGWQIKYIREYADIGGQKSIYIQLMSPSGHINNYSATASDFRLKRRKQLVIIGH